MSGRTILAFNPGSSSIKFGLFEVAPGGPRSRGSGTVDLSHTPLSLTLKEGEDSQDIPMRAARTDDLHDVIAEALATVTERLEIADLAAVGHRVVHGGDRFMGPVAITDETLAEIEALVPLAPLHQPNSLRLIRAVQHLRPALPQTASFDTAFHAGQSNLVRRFALPRALFDEGIKRYGFHGLSYAFIAERLRRTEPALAAGRVVVAHLGSGASLCGMIAGVSRDTTMGFSTLDGIPMETRSGALDPGVVLHLIKARSMSVEAVEEMLYHGAGLLGVSGLSSDPRDLLESEDPVAREALALFAFRTAREVAAVATTLGGLDGLVFTGGLGQHQPAIRAAIVQHLGWLGVAINNQANARDAVRIDSGGPVAVLVLATDEAHVIAAEAMATLGLDAA